MAALVTYFSLTFLASWTLWIAAALIPASALSPGLRAQFFVPGTFAPAFVAVALTARAGGRGGVAALLSGLFAWDVDARWYVLAAGYIAAIKLAAAAAHRLITGGWPVFGEVPWYLLLAATVFSTPFQAGEEIGWRGFALPRLAQRLGLGAAGALLGIIWAAWHLPLFYIPATDLAGQPFLPYLLAVTAISVALAWLYGHTRGSLLLVMLMHASYNNLSDLVPSAVRDTMHPAGQSTALVMWLTRVFLWAGAALFLATMPRGPAQACPTTDAPTACDTPSSEARSPRRLP